MTQFLGWRWIFFINVPIGLAVVAALAWLVPHGRERDRPRMDLAGALLLAGGLAAAILALSWLAEDGARGPSLAAATAAAALLAALAILERRQPAPVLRFGLLRLPGVRAANATLLLNAGALGATLFFLTLYLQVVLGYPPLAVGAAFAPITLLILLLSPRAAKLTTRFGVRRLLAAAMFAAAAAIAGMLPRALGRAAATEPRAHPVIEEEPR